MSRKSVSGPSSMRSMSFALWPPTELSRTAHNRFMDQKDTIRNQFGPVAEHYASSAVHAGGPDLDALVGAIPPGTTRLLDAGCGTGHTAIACAPAVQRVTAIDLTEPMLAQARRLAAERGGDNIEFLQADVEALPFPAGSFDVVTSRYSAHHYPHPAQALREFARVLKPGGSVLLVDVMAPDDVAADTFLNGIELLRDPSHVRDHTVDQWLAMFESSGFDGAALDQWPLTLEFEPWLARMQTPSSTAAEIARLMALAPSETRKALAIRPDHTFAVTVALIRAHRPGD
jgi:ubiquinone/menaquinone biosynthesis C-methylase UbiE